jgi:hypothetical protein
MKNYLGLLCLLAVNTAQAGVNLEEEEYLEMADIVVEGQVTASDCVGSAEDADTIQTDYRATIEVGTRIKGESAPDVLTIQSRVVEYKGDQPSCGENGRIHPSGETATYYLKVTDVDGVYKDVDQFSTYPSDDSAPNDAPVCDEGDEGDEGDDIAPIGEEKGCSTLSTAPTLLFWVPMLVLARRKL